MTEENSAAAAETASAANNLQELASNMRAVVNHFKYSAPALMLPNLKPARLGALIFAGMGLGERLPRPATLVRRQQGVALPGVQHDSGQLSQVANPDRFQGRGYCRVDSPAEMFRFLVT